MTDHIPPVNNFPNVPPSTPPSWSQRVVTQIGHIWSAFTSIPSQLLALVRKIGALALSIFKSSTPQKDDGPDGPDGGGTLSTPSRKFSIVVDVSRSDLKSTVIAPPDSPVSLSPASSVLATEELTSIPKVPSRVIDVPNDGNCLFSAVAVGLKAKHPADPKWDKIPSPNTLKDGSAISETKIKPIALKLRSEAVKYLEDHVNKNDEEADLLRCAIIGNITDYCEDKLKENIRSQKQLIDFLSENSKESELETAKSQLKTLETEYKESTDMSPKDYIKMVRKDGFFTGTAVIMALAKLYNTPIKVISDSDASLNQEFNILPNVAPISIIHAHGNHFKAEL